MSADNASTAELHKAETYFSKRSAYSVMEIIGQGCFGKVARCVKVPTKETVALKILKNDPGLIQDADVEEAMLEAISVLNPDQTNLVKFYERFDYMGETCLAFEMLDIHLYGMMKENNWTALYSHEIRPIAQQLLVALDALGSLGIVHTDIKTDNIMVVNRNAENIQVKLIDFGLAMKTKYVRHGMKVQPRGYRAPEVALGLPFNGSIDVWGLGCVLAFLYLADNLFSISCDHQMMSAIVKVVGQPSDQMLRDGIYTRHFFIEEVTEKGSSWKLMTPQEFKAANNIEAKERKTFWELPNSVDDLVHVYPKEDEAEWQERLAFVDLLKHLLHLNGKDRIRPRDALQHHFFGMPSINQQPDGIQQGVIGIGNISEQDSGCHTSPAGSTNEAPTSIDKVLVSVVNETGEGPHMCTGVQSSSSWLSERGHLSGSPDEDASSTWPTDMAQLADSKDYLPPASPDWDVFPEDIDVSLSSVGANTKDSCNEVVPPRSPDWDALQDDGDFDLPSVGANAENSCNEVVPPRSPNWDALPDDGAFPQPSEGALPPNRPDRGEPSDKENVCTSEEVQLTSSPPAASVKPGRAQKMLKRLRSFFSRIAAPFCCCLRGEED